MDTGKVQDTSIGKKSTKIQTLASGSKKVEKPLPVAPMKSVNVSTLETLTELLSLIQEDCRRYSEALAPYLQERLPVFMKFKGDGIIYIACPPGHVLGTDKGHITLDGKPVTGWEGTDKPKEAETLTELPIEKEISP